MITRTNSRLMALGAALTLIASAAAGASLKGSPDNNLVTQTASADAVPGSSTIRLDHYAPSHSQSAQARFFAKLFDIRGRRAYDGVIR